MENKALLSGHTALTHLSSPPLPLPRRGRSTSTACPPSMTVSSSPPTASPTMLRRSWSSSSSRCSGVVCYLLDAACKYVYIFLSALFDKWLRNGVVEEAERPPALVDVKNNIVVESPIQVVFGRFVWHEGSFHTTFFYELARLNPSVSSPHCKSLLYLQLMSEMMNKNAIKCYKCCECFHGK